MLSTKLLQGSISLSILLLERAYLFFGLFSHPVLLFLIEIDYLFVRLSHFGFFEFFIEVLYLVLQPKVLLFEPDYIVLRALVVTISTNGVMLYGNKIHLLQLVSEQNFLTLEAVLQVRIRQLQLRYDFTLQFKEALCLYKLLLLPISELNYGSLLLFR